MHIHILGICGTFMAGVAALAKAQGHTVTGCDAQVYPPMSEQLQALGIAPIEGYGADQTALGLRVASVWPGLSQYMAVGLQRLVDQKKASQRSLYFYDIALESGWILPLSFPVSY